MKKLITIGLLISTLTGSSQVNTFLIARNTGQYPLYNGDTIRVFGFTERLKDEVNIPGPTLYYNEGDSVTIDLWNVSQGAPHTIHLHGLDVDQANDGVPHLSFDVAHMDHGFYRFKAPHAGTYLYHCHVVSTLHVQAGMYGLIIIRPPNGSFNTWAGGHAYHSEQNWMTSEVDTNWHKDGVLNHNHNIGGGIMRVEIPEYRPQHFLVNGLSEQQLTDSSTALLSSVNEEVYLRIANIGYYGNTFHFPSSYHARIVSSDGRPLPQLERSDSLRVFPGERYGVLLKAISEFIDSVALDYFNLNTAAVVNTQWIPAQVAGFFSTPELETTPLSVYPNPATDDIRINTSDFKPSNWQLMNAQGRLYNVTVNAVADGIYELNLAELAPGLYYLNAIGRNQIKGAAIIKK